jgi:3-hydroxyacyl-[acyl-carrier-protein] dehydratase
LISLNRPLINPQDYPPDQPELDLAGIQELIPHRHEFTQLHSVLSFDPEAETCVGFRRADPDEFWIRGHVPGRPMLPGVLMIETLAQTGIVHAHHQYVKGEVHPWIGFGGVEKVRFRGVVEPGEDLWIPGHMVRIDVRRGYVKWEGQILRGNGDLIASATIIGMSF